MYKLYKDLHKTIKALLKCYYDSKESSILLKHALGLEDKNFLLIFDAKINYLYLKIIFKRVERRMAGEPISYIINKKDFYDYTFYVNSNVLIPRPESELFILNFTLDDIDKINYLDICTGSGCILLSIFKLNSNQIANCCGIDISIRALKVASKNYKLLAGYQKIKKVSFIKQNIFAYVKSDRKYNFITCNPPYISLIEYENLMKDVKDFEPKNALYGGVDGLSFFRKIEKISQKLLDHNGNLLIELGDQQLDKVIKIFHKNYKVVEIYPDLSNKYRIIKLKQKK